jgi:hypothetical protein
MNGLENAILSYKTIDITSLFDLMEEGNKEHQALFER